MQKWDGVSEFVAVSETESFTKAAKQLAISTAQVSRQVSALEERLKIKLLYRTTRKVSLTESGAVYYEHCRHILDGLSEAEQIITNLHDKLHGKIRITAPVTYGEEIITPIINDFLLKYPEIEITLDLSNQRADLLDDGYDLAIRLGQLKDSRFIARKLASRQLFICASPAYIARHGMPNLPNELNQHNCLIGTADRWHLQIKGKVTQININGNLRCNSGYGLVDAALKGIGLVQLPNYYVQSHISSGQLIPMLEKFQEADEGIWAVYPDKRYPPFKIKALINFILAQLET
ncbi:MAG: LysR family transcriptional regulator [Alphaproteobacteria bacterium]|nr:LysR family transcriptional regulator [Alphaproteobacteria bacterium]